MAYDISSIDIVSGELQITPAGWVRVLQRVEAALGYLLEVLDDARVDPENYLDGCRLRHVPWTGEGSGRGFDALREVFLPAFDGDAALLLCWEGGDSYTGLIVRDGVVSEGAVVQTVVPLDARDEETGA